eukprot:ANDGO_08282.mRNA.1 hypothetical protein
MESSDRRSWRVLPSPDTARPGIYPLPEPPLLARRPTKIEAVKNPLFPPAFPLNEPQPQSPSRRGGGTGGGTGAGGALDPLSSTAFGDSRNLDRFLNEERRKSRIVYWVMGIHILILWAVVALLLYNTTKLQQLAGESNYDVAKVSANSVSANSLLVSSNGPQQVSVESKNAAASLAVKSHAGTASLVLEDSTSPVSIASANGVLVVQSGTQPAMKVSASGSSFNGSVSTSSLMANTINLSAGEATTFSFSSARHSFDRIAARIAVDTQHSLSFSPTEGFSLSKGSDAMLQIRDSIVLRSALGAVVNINNVRFDNQTISMPGLLLSNSGIAASNGSFGISVSSGDVTIFASQGRILAQSDLVVAAGGHVFASNVHSLPSEDLRIHSHTGLMTINTSRLVIGPADAVNVSVTGKVQVAAGDGTPGSSATGFGAGGDGSKGGDITLRAGTGGAGGSSGGFSGAGGDGGAGGNVFLVPGTGGAVAAVDVLHASAPGIDGEVIVSPSCVFSGTGCPSSSASRLRISTPTPTLSFGDKGSSWVFLANSSTSGSSSFHMFSDVFGCNVMSWGSSLRNGLSNSRPSVEVEQGIFRVHQGGLDHATISVSPLFTSFTLLSQSNNASISFADRFFISADGDSLNIYSSQNTSRRLEFLSPRQELVSTGLPLSFVESANGSLQQVIISSRTVLAANGSTVQVGEAVLSFSNGLNIRSKGSQIQFRDSADVISISANRYLTVDSVEPTRFLAGVALCTSPPNVDPTCTNSILLNGSSASISSSSLSLDFASSSITADSLHGRSILFLDSSRGVFVDSTRPLSGVTSSAASGVFSDLQIFFFNSTVLSQNASIYISPADSLIISGSRVMKIGAVVLSGQTNALTGPGMVLDFSGNSLKSTSGSGLSIVSHSSLLLSSLAADVLVSAPEGRRMFLQAGARVVDGSTMVLNFTAASVRSLDVLNLNPYSNVVVQGSSGATVVVLGDASIASNIRMTPTSVTGSSLQIKFADSVGVPGTTGSIKDTARDLLLSSVHNRVILATGTQGVMVEVSPEAFTGSGGTASPLMSTSVSSFFLDFGRRTVGTSVGTESLVLRGGNDVQITGSNRIVFGSVVTAQSLTVCGSCGASFDQSFISGLQLKIDFVGSSVESQTGDLIVSSPAAGGVISLRSNSGIRLKSSTGSTGLNMRDENSNLEIDFAARQLRSMTGELIIKGEASTRIISGDAGLFLVPLGTGPAKPLKITAGAADSTLYYQRPVASCGSGIFPTHFTGQNAAGGCASAGGSVTVAAGSAFQGAGGDVSVIAGDNTAAPGTAGNVYLISGQNIGGNIGDTLVQTRQMNVYFRGAEWKVLSVGTSTGDGDFVYVGNANSTYTFDTDAYTDAIVARSRMQNLIAAETITISNEIPVSRNILTSIQIGHPTDMNIYTQLIYARALRYRFVDHNMYTGFFMDPVSILLNRSHTIDLYTTNLTARSEGFLDFQTGTQGVRMGPIDTLRTLMVEVGSVKAAVEIYRPQSNGVPATYTKLIGQHACSLCGAGGAVSIYGGSAHSASNADVGGAVSLYAGDGLSGSSGGAISIVAGSAAGAGSGGSLTIQAGTGAATAAYGGIDVRTRWFDVRKVSETYSLLHIDTHTDDTNGDYVNVGNWDLGILYSDARYTNKVQIRATEFNSEVGSKMSVVPAQTSSSQFLVGSASLFFNTIELRSTLTTIYDNANVAALTITTTTATLFRSTTLDLKTSGGAGTTINVGQSGTLTENVNLRGTNVKIWNAGTATVTVQLNGDMLIDVGASYDLKIVTGDLDVQAGKVKEYGNSIMPAGSIIMYRGSSCPPGFTAVSEARDRVLVGLPSSGFSAGASIGPGTGVSTSTFQLTTTAGAATVPLPGHGHGTSNFCYSASGCSVSSAYTGSTSASTLTVNTFNTDSRNINGILPGVYFLVCEKTL